MELSKPTQKIRESYSGTPTVALILGSGCGKIASLVKPQLKIAYSDLPEFPTATVEHHKRELLIGTFEGCDILIFNGRLHLYEGLSAKEAAMPVTIARELGVKQIIVTNAAGGLNSKLSPSDIMLLTDQINLTGQSPLSGSNDYRIGPRFPSLHQVYSRQFQALIQKAAMDVNVTLQEGIYAAVAGPETETPAELAMIKSFGADVLGMSTVYETVAAVHAGMEVAGLSIITDSVTSTEGPLTPKEAIKAAKLAGNKLNELIKKVLESLCVKPISNQ